MINNISDYQELAARTLIDAPNFEIPDNHIMLAWNALGLAGEAGEVADTIKKAVFHQHGFDTAVIAKELGDVLWYVAALCTNLDINMAAVMNENIEKLKKRYPDGWNSADSVKRVDVTTPRCCHSQSCGEWICSNCEMWLCREHVQWLDTKDFGDSWPFCVACRDSVDVDEVAMLCTMEATNER